MSIDLGQPIAVQPGSGRVLEFLGEPHKLTGDQTGGAFYVCEAIFGPERSTGWSGWNKFFAPRSNGFSR